VAISASIHAGILVARYVSHNSAHSYSREHNPTRSSRFVGKFVGKRSSAPGRDSAHDGARRDAGEAAEVIRGPATAPVCLERPRNTILREYMTRCAPLCFGGEPTPNLLLGPRFAGIGTPSPNGCTACPSSRSPISCCWDARMSFGVWLHFDRTPFFRSAREVAN
jgi:hypothetical protein